MNVNPDRSPIRDSASLDELVDHFAYPGELPVLADLARMFIALGSPSGAASTGCRLTDAQALQEAVFMLLAAMEHVLGAEPVDGDPAIVPWRHIVDLAYESVEFPDASVGVWREVLSLSDDEKLEFLSAAREAGR